MNFNSKNISGLIILIGFCFLTFYSCKKVTKNNEFEYFSGMLIRNAWWITMDSIPYHESHDSAISTITIQHISNRVGNKKDTIEVSFPTLTGYTYLKTLYFVDQNSDSINYSEDQVAGIQSTLVKYKKTSKMSMTISSYSGHSGGDSYSFSGIEK